jgi:hypothetical protein
MEVRVNAVRNFDCAQVPLPGQLSAQEVKRRRMGKDNRGNLEERGKGAPVAYRYLACQPSKGTNHEKEI